MKLEAIRAKIAKQPPGKAIGPYELDRLRFAEFRYVYVMGQTTFDPSAIPAQSPKESAFEQRVFGLVRLK